MNIQISKTTINTLVSNIWDEVSEKNLDVTTSERKLLVLTQFLKDPNALVSWAKDFESDANLSKDDFPVLTQEYRTAAKELRLLNLLYKVKPNEV